MFNHPQLTPPPPQFEDVAVGCLAMWLVVVTVWLAAVTVAVVL